MIDDVDKGIHYSEDMSSSAVGEKQIKLFCVFVGICVCFFPAKNRTKFGDELVQPVIPFFYQAPATVVPKLCIFTQFT